MILYSLHDICPFALDQGRCYYITVGKVENTHGEIYTNKRKAVCQNFVSTDFEKYLKVKCLYTLSLSMAINITTVSTITLLKTAAAGV